MECICYLKFGDFIEIDNTLFKVKNVQGDHKTKRRYESSLWHPKGVGYNKYKLSLINVFTKEVINNTYNAIQQVKIIYPIKTKYYVTEINKDNITLLTENYDETKINIETVDIDVIEKINELLNNGNDCELIITFLSGKIISCDIIYQ